jgi:hypothetical protein
VVVVAALESLDLWWWWGVGVELTLVLVLVEDEREKVKLAFVEMVRCDCWDMPDADRCRTRVLYCFFEWEGARCGITGASGRWTGAAAGICCGGAVKKQERWFGSGDRDLLAGDSISGLVGGVVPLVTALSDMSSSDRCDEPVEDADMGLMSGALYDSMLVVWMSSMGFEILWRREPTDALVELARLGAFSASAAFILCLTRRVVNALAIDMMAACSYSWSRIGAVKRLGVERRIRKYPLPRRGFEAASRLSKLPLTES